MEAMRESWTDGRMDDLNHRVDDGFNRIDADLRGLRSDTTSEFASVRSEMKAEFAAVRSEMKAGFDRLDARFDAMQRTMIQFAGVMIAALIALFAAQIGVIVT